MANSSTYYAVYTEELTEDDRAALDRPGFKLYPDGIQVSDAWFVGAENPPVEFHSRQIVRMEAESAEQAVSRVVEALGRTPEGLQAFRANESVPPT
jgi:hypothetical protein